MRVVKDFSRLAKNTTMNLTHKQREILSTATTMFCQKGYVETSMRDLAVCHQVKAASFYSHFKSKVDILTHICEQIYEVMQDGEKRIESYEGSDIDRFKNYVRRHLEVVITNFESFQVYYKYRHLVDEEQYSKYRELDLKYHQMITQIMISAFPLLKQNTSLRPEGAVIILVDFLNCIPHHINPENPQIDRVIEDIQSRLTVCLLWPSLDEAEYKQKP